MNSGPSSAKLWG